MNGTYVITEYEEKIMGFLLDEKKLVSAEYFSEDDLLYNIYSAKVIDYVPSIGAAFLDAGLSDTLYYPLKENEDKHLYIISGPNGAGKTTASYSVLPKILQCKEFVNADEIARGLYS